MKSTESPESASSPSPASVLPLVPLAVVAPPVAEPLEASDFASGELADLAGFNMVAAVSQDTLNYQIKKLWQAGIIRKELKVEVTELGITLDAILGPPKVKLGIADDRRSALFTLHLASGTLRYWEGFGPNAKEKTLEFQGWSFAFRVNLDMREIAQAAIEAGKAIPPEVKAKLQGFSDSIFTVRSLFMDFQSANLADFDARESAMPLADGSAAGVAVIKALKDALAIYFKSLAGADNPYVLGYSAVRRGAAVDAPALFAPTSATFSTVRAAKEGESALNFLLMLGGAEPPKSPLAGLFVDNWITSADYDGRMVIAAAPFRGRYIEGQLLPAIAGALGHGSTPFVAVASRADIRSKLGFTDGTQEVFERCFGGLNDGPGWATYHYRDNLNVDDGHGNVGYGVIVGTDSGILKIYREDRQAISFLVELLPGSDIAFRGRGKAWVTNHYFEYPFNARTWMAGVDVQLDFGFDARVIAGADGRLTVDATFTDNAPTAWHDTNALVKFSDFFTGLFGSTFGGHIERGKGVCQSIQSAIVRDIEDQLRRRFEALSVPVILPAGGVFFYKNAARDRDANVLFDISYKRDH